jgi:RNA polymerase sigma-70 factor (ECF subfamily)
MIRARVSYAAALAQAREAEAALGLLDELGGADAVAEYQAYWATRAHVLARVGRAEEARAAFGRASGLTTDPAVRAFLQERAAELG